MKVRQFNVASKDDESLSEFLIRASGYTKKYEDSILDYEILVPPNKDAQYEMTFYYKLLPEEYKVGDLEYRMLRSGPGDDDHSRLLREASEMVIEFVSQNDIILSGVISKCIFADDFNYYVETVLYYSSPGK
jgi:hypothetical protein